MRILFIFLASVVGYTTAKAQFYTPGNTLNSGNGNAGIDVVGPPLEKFQIGDRWTFHNGGHKVISYNAYHSAGDKRMVDDESANIRFTSQGDIQFGTAAYGAAASSILWNVPLFLSNNGNVGMGTDVPVNNLDLVQWFGSGTDTKIFVGQDHNFGANSGRYGIGLSFEHVDGTSQGKKYHINTWFANTLRKAMTFDYLGNVGIGTTNPLATLHTIGGATSTSISNIHNTSSARFDVANPAISLNIGYLSTDIPLIQSSNNYLNSSTNLSINPFGGNVGIGTADPGSFKLAVNGKIWSQEVNVAMTNPGPDYVFEKDYNLLPLSELEAYITQNKHLPEVPSAKEMEADGLNLKEMNLLLLKKVEELTLHIIALEKRVSNTENR